MSSREDTPEPATSAASTGQAAPAPQGDNRENSVCPECRDISTTCSSSCRHCFCQLCLWDWSLGRATCPRCGRLTRHPYPPRLALYHELQDRVYDSKRRWRGHSAGPPRSSPGHRGHGRPGESRRGSLRWPRDGRRRSRPSRGSDSPRRRRRWWRQHRRVWEDTPAEGSRPNFDWAIPASSRGNQSRRRSSRSQQERSQGHRRQSREHSRGWDRRQSGSSSGDQDAQPGSRDHPSRRWRSWDADDRHTPRLRDEVPSESSETEQGEDSDYSRYWHTRRRPSRARSHRRGQNSQETAPRDCSTNQRRWRSWDAEDSDSPRPQRDTPSRRSERHQWEDWDSSRQQHATRSQTRGRSHSRGQNSQTASQAPHNHSTRQRRSWNADQGQAPRSQRDSLGSSRRSRSRRQSWSRAGHRDT